MKKAKKLLSVLLCMVLLAGLLSITAFAADTQTIKLAKGETYVASSLYTYTGPMTLTLKGDFVATVISTGGKEVYADDDGYVQYQEGYFTYDDDNMTLTVPSGKVYIQGWSDANGNSNAFTYTGPFSTYFEGDAHIRELGAGGTYVENEYGQIITRYGPYTETYDSNLYKWELGAGGKLTRESEYSTYTLTGPYSDVEIYDGDYFREELKLGDGATETNVYNDGDYSYTDTTTGPYTVINTNNGSTYTLSGNGKNVYQASDGMYSITCAPYTRTSKWDEHSDTTTTYYGGLYKETNSGGKYNYTLTKKGTVTTAFNTDGYWMHDIYAEDAEISMEENGLSYTVHGPAKSIRTDKDTELYTIEAGGYAIVNGSKYPMLEGGTVEIIFNDDRVMSEINVCGTASLDEGWNFIGGKWYFVENGEVVTNQWRKDSIGWCLLGDDGAMLTDQWTTDSDGWCYIGPDGYCVTGTYTIDGVDHSFDSEGNWLGEADGSNASDMTEGWNLVDGKWYFVEGGKLVTNQWRKDSIGWCYLGDDGAMYTNTWLQDSVGWCYIGAEGYCLVGTHTIDGVSYTFDADGRWIEGATGGSSSAMAEGWNLVDGKWYFVENGSMVTNQWRRDSIGWCYLGDDGAMLTDQWTTDSDGWCYIGSDGYCVTGTYTIGGVAHNFDSEGNWLGEA